jgi:hypothetical protein
MTIIERARKYVESCPDAISGQGGHAATFRVACALVHGFALNDTDAMMLMMEFNGRCNPKWSERDLRHKLNSAGRAVHTNARGWMVEGRGVDGSAPVWIPPAKKEKIIFDAEILKRVQRAEWTCDHVWLRARSVCDPREVSCGAFIDALYAKDDQVMCFTSMRSVGDYMRWRGGWFELGKQPGIKARRVKEGPRGSREGCVMLIQPMDGKWHPVEGSQPPRLSRRTRSSVLHYRYMLWESDDAPESLWLNALAQVRLPIVAITTSAGRSLHALVRVDALSYDEWSQMRSAARDFMTQLGFDPQSLSNPTAAIRMPNTMREGKINEGRLVPFETGPRMQRLIYWNPEAVAGECIGDRCSVVLCAE